MQRELDFVEKVILFDKTTTKIKYSFPEKKFKNKLVVFINGSGQNTYDNRRKGIDGITCFNFYDYYRNEFIKHGVAFCSYNTRGVDIGETEPLYAALNDSEYNKYLPKNSVKDVESIVHHLLQKPELKNTAVYLLGWSEGTIIAPLVALNKKAKVDALLLAGYVNENMKDTMIWQLGGNSSYISLKKYFDTKNFGYISKEEFLTDQYKVRNAFFGDAQFEDFDMNNNGKIDAEDFGIKQKPYLDNILKSIENNDDEWLKNNYGDNVGMVLKSAWFKEHFALNPTKEVLPLLDIPIFIFHGENDANCPKHYATDIKETFVKLKKTNLSVKIFEKHDHDLNFAYWLVKNEIPEGISNIFQTVYML